MFRGSASTKIDDKGRLKVPTHFRRELEESHGPDVFITSIVGDSALIYPLRVWERIEERLAGLPSTDRTRRRFLERVSYFGQAGRLDSQGRVMVPPLLRDGAAMSGEVVVSGRLKCLTPVPQALLAFSTLCTRNDLSTSVGETSCGLRAVWTPSVYEAR